MKHKDSKEDSQQNSQRKDQQIKAMNILYDKLVQNFEQLDYLNKQYRHRQQDHFIRAFAAITYKMAGQLISAKQAFQNIDLQVKKDNYCNGLKQEINQYKHYAIQLAQNVKRKDEQLKKIRHQNEMLMMQVQQLKIINISKIEECLNLKHELKTLKKKIKSIIHLQKQTIPQSYCHQADQIQQKLQDKTIVVRKMNSSRQCQYRRRQNFNFNNIYALRTAAQFKTSRRNFSVRNNIKNSLTIASNIKALQSKQYQEKSSHQENQTISLQFEDKIIKSFTKDNKDRINKPNTGHFRNPLTISISKAIQNNPQTNISNNL